MTRRLDLRTVKGRLDALRGGIVVSCQAPPGSPFHSPGPTAVMAAAAELGGAAALRVDGPRDIAAVRGVTDLPIIAINKVEHPRSPVQITPTLGSALDLLRLDPAFVALDATARPRLNGERLGDIVDAIHTGGSVALGDLATLADLDQAIAADLDAVGTALAGYTSDDPPPEEPDFAFLEALVRRSPVPVFAEGRYWTPEQAVQAFALGAAFVVIGAAISNPVAITSRFVAHTRSKRSGR